MIQNLSLNQPPTPTPHQPAPYLNLEQNPTPPPPENQTTTDNITVDDFLADTLQKAKLSADTFVDPETGTAEVISKELPSAKAEFSEAEANAQTKRLMQARDMIQARLLAWISKDPERWKEFKLDQWEFDWLCEVYADTFQKLGRIPAWLDILLAESMIMVPRMYKAYDYNKVAAENKKLKAQIKSMQSDKAGIRRDAKTLWLVDENGFFTHDTKLKYIPQQQRRVKPGLSPAEYEMLIKHNDKDEIDRIFDIN